MDVLPILPRWRLRVAQTIPWLLVLLLSCFLVQVFLAGAGLLVDASYLALHKVFIHWFEFLPILIAAAGFIATDKTAGWVGVALFVLIEAQYALIYAPSAMVHALHPVNAVIMSGIAMVLLSKRLPWKSGAA